MTSKTLTDDNGDRTSINLWASDRITLGTRQGSRYAEVGPFDPADVIAAIREALRETSKTLTDGDGHTLHIYLCHPGRVSLDSGRSGKHALVGPFDPDNLIAAIREVAGETDDKPEPTPSKSPTTARELLDMLPDLCYEPEGDVIPADTGHVIVWDDGDITVSSGGYPYAPPAVIGGGRRLLLDPPATVTPEWHSARIVEATAGGSDRVEWARTEDGYWVALGGIARTVASSALSDVTVIVPGEVEA